MPIEWNSTSGNSLTIGSTEPPVTWRVTERNQSDLLMASLDATHAAAAMEVITHVHEGRIVTEVAPSPDDELVMEPSRNLSYPVTRWDGVTGNVGASTYTYVFSNGNYPNYSGDEVLISWMRFKIADRRLVVSVGSHYDPREVDVLDTKGGVHLLATILWTMSPDDKEKVQVWVQRRAHMLKAGLRSIANQLGDMALLLYAGVPLLTQRQSVAACLNVANNYDHAQYVADMPKLDLAGLVRHYYGQHGKKLVAAVRAKVFSGHEITKVSFDATYMAQEQQSMNLFLPPGNPDNLLTTSYVTHGNRSWEARAVASANSMGIISRDEDGSITMYGNASIALWPFSILEFARKMDLPPEDVVKIVEQREAFHHHRFDVFSSAPTTEFMKLMTRHQLRTLLTSAEVNYIDDMAREWHQYRDADKLPERVRALYPDGIQVPERWKTPQELHDRISAQYRAIQAEASKKDITYRGYVEFLDGMKVRDMTFVLPRCTSKLVEWGTALNICIASYGERAHNGETLLGAVYRDGKVQYCLEYKMPHLPVCTKELPDPNGWNLVQFVKERNGKPDEDDRRDVISAMVEAVYGKEAAARILAPMNSDAQRFNEQLAAMGGVPQAQNDAAINLANQIAVAMVPQVAEALVLPPGAAEGA